VDLCLNDGRYAEAILLSISGGEELLKKTQQKYLSSQKNSISMVSVRLSHPVSDCAITGRTLNVTCLSVAHLISGDPELERHSEGL